MPGYLRATRHPWACLLFLLPLLIAYEVGVHWFGGTESHVLRNGADAWLRRVLTDYHSAAVFVPPWVILGILIIWSMYRWSDHPQEPFTACFGMLVESTIFAGLLWVVSRNFPMFLEQAGIPLANIGLDVPVGPRQPSLHERLLTYVGAGIYEEFLFRLCLISFLTLLLRIALLPDVPAKILAAILGAVLFSAAHHIGANGEKVEMMPFLFRTMAGLFFTILYLTRGFGIAVGAHAGYDIIVGVAVA